MIPLHNSITSTSFIIMARFFFFLLALTALTLHMTEGFAPVIIPPIQAPIVSFTTTNSVSPSSPQHYYPRPAVSFLSMTGGPSDDDAAERRRNQQLGAVAVLLVGILYDFFITHHGVRTF